LQFVSGRILAIGDIHGCNTALDVLLGQLQIQSDDTVVLLGDVVDRGPGTHLVIERLLELQQQCVLHFVRGNHEEMLFGVIEGSLKPELWLVHGGQEVIDAYHGSLDNVPAEHLEFLQTSVDYYETPTNVFVHANLEPGMPLAEQNKRWLRWTRFTGREEPLPSGQQVICGHTAQPEGLPVHTRGWVCIDTCVYGGGWLTCLDASTEEFFQADESGRFRIGQLSHPL
jgi:serine/threonine protein phosphatase 1